MWYCDCYQTDYRFGIFCNENNQCECQVADGGNGFQECCTYAISGIATSSDYGEGGCDEMSKSMHFHPSNASPFYCRYHYETKPVRALLSLYFYCRLLL